MAISSLLNKVQGNENIKKYRYGQETSIFIISEGGGVDNNKSEDIFWQ